MPLINCETNFILTWSEDCVISDIPGTATFAITYKKTLCTSSSFVDSR